MIKPDETILKAIKSLEGNSDWEIVRKWLKESLEQALNDCSAYRADFPSYPFNSGRAFELEELVNMIEKSKDTLEMIQRGARK